MCCRTTRKGRYGGEAKKDVLGEDAGASGAGPFSARECEGLRDALRRERWIRKEEASLAKGPWSSSYLPTPRTP